MRKTKPGADAPHAADLLGEASTHATVLPEAASQPPAKKSLLQLAMEKVNANLTEIQVMSVRIDELIAENPADKVYSVATKDAYAAVDKIRKAAREDRLAVQRLNKASKELLNDLKDQAVAVAVPYIDKLQGVEDRAKAALEAEDAKEEARQQRHRDAIAAIRRMAEGAATMSSADIDKQRTALAAIIVDDSYEEFHKEAVTAKAETQDILIQAHAAAVKREQEAAAKALAEGRQKAARERIGALKTVAEGAKDTGIENVRNMRRILADAVYTEDEFGDLTEFVGMARDAAVRDLDLLAEAIEEEERAAQQGIVPNADSSIESEAGYEGEDEPEPDTHTGNLFGAEAPPDVPPAIPEAARRAADELDANPFIQPAPRATAPAARKYDTVDGLPPGAARIYPDEPRQPANVAPGATPPRMLPSGRMPIPQARTLIIANDGARHGGEPQRIAVTLPAAPAPTAAPTLYEDERHPPGARGAADITVTEVPNLLKAAQDFVTSAEECCGWTNPANVPEDLIPAWRALREATALLSEFPPSN